MIIKHVAPYGGVSRNRCDHARRIAVAGAIDARKKYIDNSILREVYENGVEVIVCVFVWLLVCICCVC